MWQFFFKFQAVTDTYLTKIVIQHFKESIGLQWDPPKDFFQTAFQKGQSIYIPVRKDILCTL